MSILKCDADSGMCTVSAVEQPEGALQESAGQPEIIYFGDPMCSWCWGISPQLRMLRNWCQSSGIAFRVVQGGLRPGGGDAWNSQFREFLRHHWQHVSQMSGQPFNDAILDWNFFDYDTEPACRSVVAARALKVDDLLEFMSKVQRKFYVDNEDPKKVDFYRSICADFALDVETFVDVFQSDEIKERTRDDFDESRRAGVTSFPTVALMGATGKIVIATGFATFEEMRLRTSDQLPS